MGFEYLLYLVAGFAGGFLLEMLLNRYVKKKFLRRTALGVPAAFIVIGIRIILMQAEMVQGVIYLAGGYCILAGLLVLAGMLAADRRFPAKED